MAADGAVLAPLAAGISLVVDRGDLGAPTAILFASAPSGIFTPNCLSMLTTDWLENFTWVVSPLPFRPTTSP